MARTITAFREAMAGLFGAAGLIGGVPTASGRLVGGFVRRG